jgi:hypothetical protein
VFQGDVCVCCRSSGPLEVAGAEVGRVLARELAQGLLVQPAGGENTCPSPLSDSSLGQRFPPPLNALV